jgi:cob(I)alamin adenosyltransferase
VALTEESERLDPDAVTYVNRLSDTLYTFSGLVNYREDALPEAPSYET